MAEDEKEQTEFDEELNRQEALNTETAGNEIVPDEESHGGGNCSGRRLSAVI